MNSLLAVVALSISVGAVCATELCPNSGLALVGATTAAKSASTRALPKAWTYPTSAASKPISLQKVYEIDSYVGGVYSSLVDPAPLRRLPNKDQAEIASTFTSVMGKDSAAPWSLDTDKQARLAHVTNIMVAVKENSSQLHPLAWEALKDPNFSKQDYRQLLQFEEGIGRIKVLPFAESTISKTQWNFKFDFAPILMIAGGGITDPGDLGALQPGQHVGRGSTSTGEPCYRAAEPSDFLPRKDGEINVVYDPLAFLDVGKITYRSQDGKRRHLCTLTAISENHAITAAHCVLKESPFAPGGYIISDSLKNPEQAVVLFPTAEHSREDGLDCLGMTGPCNFHRAKIVDILVPDGQAWRKGEPVPVHDVALLKLEYLSGKPPIRARLGSTPAKGADISIVGYGVNDIAGKVSRGIQYAGWQRIRYVEERGFGWTGDSFADAKRVTSACMGDSGGPVYGGIVSNVPTGFNPPLSGLLSFIIPVSQGTTLTDAEVCERATVRAVALRQYKKFICDTVGQSAFCTAQ